MTTVCPVLYTSSAGSVATDRLTKQILTVFNRLLALDEFGAEEENATATQGGCRPYTSYSGPTHRGCGAIDFTPWNWQHRFTLLDLLGIVPFHRTRAQGPWNNHVHCVTNGLACVDRYARGQITEAKAGGDGLNGDDPDPDKDRRSGLWPVAVYQGRTGKLQATKATHLYDGPASSRQVVVSVSKGHETNALMEVTNRFGNVWFVNAQGRWGASSRWVKV